MNPPFFDDSLPRAARAVRETLLNVPLEDVRFIRDAIGRLFVVVPDIVDDERLAKLQTRLADELGPYSPGRTSGLARCKETLSPESLFNEPFLTFYIDDERVRLIERRVLGQDWILQPLGGRAHPPRVTFYSVKGGVGRTTALLLWARDLVMQGRSVLVVDFDLEAPGIAAQILTPGDLPEFGVVDWLVEDLVGRADEAMLDELFTRNVVLDAPGLSVVPAAGRRTQTHADSYIAKLARAYLEGESDDQAAAFASRTRRLIEALERRTNPDVVLVDSRAGLHESAAATILHLNAHVLLFAVDLPATWEGYRFLFGHLRHSALAAMTTQGDDGDWRDQLKMVHARATPLREDERRFVSNAYSLWLDTLYDELPPEPEPSPYEAFSFEETDDSAPHWPLTILRSDVFERFSPLAHLSEVGENAVREAFGDFFTGLSARILGSSDEP